jgi:hypothetical protein
LPKTQRVQGIDHQLWKRFKKVLSPQKVRVELDIGYWATVSGLKKFLLVKGSAVRMTLKIRSPGEERGLFGVPFNITGWQHWGRK